MSWSASASGSKEEVRSSFTGQISYAKTMYPEDTQEGQDVRYAEQRVNALLDAVPHEKVYASAHGSYSTVNGKITHAQMHVSVDPLAPLE